MSDNQFDTQFDTKFKNKFNYWNSVKNNVISTEKLSENKNGKSPAEQCAKACVDNADCKSWQWCKPGSGCAGCYLLNKETTTMTDKGHYAGTKEDSAMLLASDKYFNWKDVMYNQLQSGRTDTPNDCYNDCIKNKKCTAWEWCKPGHNCRGCYLFQNYSTLPDKYGDIEQDNKGKINPHAMVLPRTIAAEKEAKEAETAAKDIIIETEKETQSNMLEIQIGNTNRSISNLTNEIDNLKNASNSLNSGIKQSTNDIIAAQTQIETQIKDLEKKRNLLITRNRMLQLSQDRNLYKQKVIYTLIALVIVCFILIIIGYVGYRKLSA